VGRVEGIALLSLSNDRSLRRAPGRATVSKGLPTLEETAGTGSATADSRSACPTGVGDVPGFFAKDRESAGVSYYLKDALCTAEALMDEVRRGRSPHGTLVGA
jgi:hypothetical protein